MTLAAKFACPRSGLREDLEIVIIRKRVVVAQSAPDSRWRAAGPERQGGLHTANRRVQADCDIWNRRFRLEAELSYGRAAVVVFDAA